MIRVPSPFRFSHDAQLGDGEGLPLRAASRDGELARPTCSHTRRAERASARCTLRRGRLGRHPRAVHRGARALDEPVPRVDPFAGDGSVDIGVLAGRGARRGRLGAARRVVHRDARALDEPVPLVDPLAGDGSVRTHVRVDLALAGDGSAHPAWRTIIDTLSRATRIDGAPQDRVTVRTRAARGAKPVAVNTSTTNRPKNAHSDRTHTQEPCMCRDVARVPSSHLGDGRLNGAELAGVPLGPGEDARTGPGRVTQPRYIEMYRLRPGTCAPRRGRRGGGGQDGPR